ncbi:MAG: metalloregulator ArsR/SmtB family transcription factor [Candidatus Saganbacteria bacterium]|nr:metalloregulator ArsR/SmtB family transcription factor [Candidatus Saganbacteria bacterium]
MANRFIVNIFRALSDETRLQIIRLLSSGERCVCELFASLRLSQPKVSRHLAYLRRVGLVRNRKEGLWQYYSLNHKLIDRFKLKNVLGIKKDKAKNKKERGCCVK